MRASKLRDRVTIEEQATGSDGMGGDVFLAWEAITDGSRIPARVEPLSGDERLAAQQVQSSVDYTVRVRYRPGITADNRVIWHLGDGDRTLHIVGAPVIIGHREGLRFQAREGAD